MEFCPNCSKHLILSREGKTALYCSKCGYKKQIKVQSKTRDATHQIIENVIAINPAEGELNGDPLIHLHCPKCSNQHAYFLITEIEEEEIPLYRCTRCHYVWR